MLFDTLERKVRRLFGDENNIVIERQDIIDWANSAMVDIARTTQCLPFDITQAANTFPATYDDFISMYRMTYGTPASVKTFTTLESIDSESVNNSAAVGQPKRYYIRGNRVYLYPTPELGDTTPVTVTYNRMPAELTLVAVDPLDVPISYHEDLVRYCLARAYEKNENYQAQETSDSTYKEGLAQRIWEKNQADESFPFVRPDPMDYQ